MRWLEVHKGDVRCRLLADGHYSRQTPGAPMFTRPGYSQVLYLAGPKGGAAFVWWRPKWEEGVVRKDGLRAIECTLFRNESGFLSSELIVEACAAVQTWDLALNTAWPDGLITGVSSGKTAKRRSKRALPGECFRRAGWEEFQKPTPKKKSSRKPRADIWLRCLVLPAPERAAWDGPVSVPKARAA